MSSSTSLGGRALDTQDSQKSQALNEDPITYIYTQLATNPDFTLANKSLLNLQQPSNNIFSLSEIAAILTTHCTPKRPDKTIEATIKAISTILRLYDNEYANYAIVREVENRLESIVKLTQGKLDTSIEKLERNIKHIEVTANKCSELTLNTQTHTKTLTDAIQSLNGPASQATPSTQLSYSNALRQVPALPVTSATSNNAKIFNRLNIQAAQILVEFKPDSEATKLIRDQPSEAASILKAKANEALGKATEGSNIKSNIKNVIITRRGALLIELNSAEAAAWLRKISNEKKFINAFMAGSSFRRKTFPVIIKFVPIRWTPELPATLRELEEKLDLVKDSVLEAKWIKDPARRGKTQEKAHIKVHCADPNTANKILISAVHICNAKVIVERDTWEPSVCGKCQEYGHFAAECNKSADKCGQCSGSHRTIFCMNQVITVCTPCGARDHISNSPQCPEYVKRIKAQQLKSPESLLPFYPTEQPWTWELDGTSVPWIDAPSRKFNLGQAFEARQTLGGPYTRRPYLSTNNRSKPKPKQSTLPFQTNPNTIPLGNRRRSHSLESNRTARERTPTAEPTAPTSPVSSLDKYVLPTDELRLSEEPDEAPKTVDSPASTTPIQPVDD